MKSPTMALAAVAVGAVAGVAAWAVPANLMLPLVVGGAMSAFVFYVLRERAALRALIGPVRRLVQRDNHQAKVLTAIRERLNEHASASVGHGALLERIAGSVDRTGQVWHELAALSAASTAEILDRVASTADVIERDGDRVSAELLNLDRRIGEAHTELQADVRKARSDVLVGAGRDFAQLEATMNLHRLLPVRAAMPPSRHWAASPDLLLLLVSCVLDRRPGLIVELGGGLSTVWLAYAVEKVGSGRIISVDHDETFAARTRDTLASHGLDAVAEVRVAPLKEVEVAGEVYPWYDRDSLSDVRGCELLLVDGPPGNTRQRGRYPALPLLHDSLAEHAVVILDDCIRRDEQDVVAAWQAAFPEFHVQIHDHEKGTAVLTRSG